MKKKKYTNKNFNFIVFQTSEKPVNFTIPKWVFIATSVFVCCAILMAVCIAPILLYVNFSKTTSLETSYKLSQDKISSLEISNEAITSENSSLKTTLSEKAQEIENSAKGLEELKNTINKIKELYNISDETISTTTVSNGGSRSGSFAPRSMFINNLSGSVNNFSTVFNVDMNSSLESSISTTIDELSSIETIISDKVQYYKDVPSITPAYGKYSSYFGPRWGALHRGVDISGIYGSSIIAAGNGTVIESGYNGSYGYYVLVQHKYGFVTRYAHLSKSLVSKWQEVEQGEVIGYMGNTGYSFGTHLHYEIMYYGQLIDPLTVESYFEE